MRIRPTLVALAAALAATAAAPGAHAQSEASTDIAPATSSAIKTVFVIALENHDAGEIYGNTKDAPYINNTLLPAYAHSTNFTDELPQSIPSEPHYVWMEAGTNKFSDHTFTTDNDASKSNSTKSTAHLVTQIQNAGTGVTWMTYQEGITAATGTCPITSSGFYAAKHDPFVFFRDVSGSPPSKSNAYCTSHHKDLSKLAADLGNHAVATFNFITPNLCNDMHGATGCPNSNEINSGDQWLQANLPALIAYANSNQGAIFLTWDEGDSTSKMPFIAIGPHVKTGYTGTVLYNHSSLLKSIERILEVPILSTVTSANDFTDLFVAGFFP
jgi:hypothetical protein